MNIENIKARTIEVGECWEWQGCFTKSGIPIMYHEGERTTVRRVVYQLKYGKKAPQTFVVSTSCGNYRCVCENHIRSVPRAKMLEKTRANTNHALRAAKIAETKRRTEAKLTPAQVQMIRESGESNIALASQLGVHHSLLSAIRNGKAWVDYSNPFAGLGAR